MAMTMKVNRMEAIRMVGEAIRTRTQEFERAKKDIPAQMEKVRSVVLKAAEKRVKEVLQATTIGKLNDLARADLMEWKYTKDFPLAPSLNVCSLRSLLLLLQNDTRKTVPIRSDHELWAILQGKCEVIHG
jgi:hypothetical protein